MGVPAGENPFRVERLHGVPYWEPGCDLDALAARAESLDWRCAIVGKHGNGKTTLLLELGERLAGRGIAVEQACVGDEARWESSVVPQSDTVYLLDGVERLSATAWMAFRWHMRSAKGMIITAHSPGRLPTLHTCRTTPETVVHLLTALNPPGLEALVQRATVLHLDHAGDCRAILFALYDEFAGRTGNGSSTVPMPKSTEE